LIEFNNGTQAIVLNLEEDNVGAVLLGSTEGIKEGDTVKRTGRIASINVGEGMLGRVVNTLASLSTAKARFWAKYMKCYSNVRLRVLSSVNR